MNNTEYIAIDLGTTNSVVGAIQDDGTEVIVKNLDGETSTPSFIWVKENKGTDTIDFIVGKKAKELMSEDPEDVLSSYKPSMGTNKIIKIVKRRSFTAKLCSAAVLQYLKRSAEADLNSIVTKAIITVPAYFDDKQKQETRAAATLAGLEVIQLVAEPTAAGFYYGKIGKDKVDKNILAYDLGGGTFDVSILLAQADGDVIVQRVGGDKHLGGDDVDQALAKRIIEKASEDNKELIEKIVNDTSLFERFIRRAEEAKITLSKAYREGKKQSRTTVNIPKNKLTEEFPETINVSLKEFLDVLKPFIDRTISITQDIVNQAGLEIDEVLLIGGSTKLPLIREGLIDLLQNPKFDIEYFDDYLLDPDQSVALGAREILKDYLNNNEISITDAVSLPIGIEMATGEFKPIIGSGTPLPARGTYDFTNPDDNQRQLTFGIYEGVSKLAKENHQLGEVAVEIKPSLRGKVKGLIKILVNREGLITAKVKIEDKILTYKLSGQDKYDGDEFNNIIQNKSTTKKGNAVKFGK